MRKFKKLFLMFCLSILLSLTFAVVACDNKNQNTPPQGIVEGDLVYEYTPGYYPDYEEGYFVNPINQDISGSLTIPSTYNGKPVFVGRFTSCKNLTNVVIENGVTKIVGYAFDGCTSLETITIPASVVEIQDHAFSSTSYTVNITFLGTRAQWYAIKTEHKSSLRYKTLTCSDD